MGVEPVAGGAVAGCKAHVALVDALHFLDDNALNSVEFTGDDVKVEFVVHLQNHLGVDALVLEAAVDTHHGQFDDIGGSALNGRVDGVALAEAPHYGIARVDVGQHATATV